VASGHWRMCRRGTTRAVAEPSTPTELNRARAVTCGLLAYTESSLERVTRVLTRARGLSGGTCYAYL